MLSGTSKEGGLGGTLGILGKARIAEEKSSAPADLAAINALTRTTGISPTQRDLSILNLAQKELERQNIFKTDEKGLPNPLYDRALQEIIKIFNNQLGA
jgi:hypothetical protein